MYPVPLPPNDTQEITSLGIGIIFNLQHVFATKTNKSEGRANERKETRSWYILHRSSFKGLHMMQNTSKCSNRGGLGRKMTPEAKRILHLPFTGGHPFNY